MVAIFSGVLAATSSMFMPPSVEAMKATREVSRSTRQREVKLLGDGGAFFDVEALHQLSGRPCLMGDQRHAQHAAGFGPHVGHGFHDLHAATLAAAAGMDLGFDHPDGAWLAFGGLHRFIDREGCDALAG